MTSQSHSTTAPDAASTCRTAEEWAEAIDNIYSEIAVISHLTHFLLTNLEWDFDSQRARRSDDRTITFSFSKDGVESVVWLAGEVWAKADALKKTIVAHQAAADQAADAEVRS